MQAELTDIPKCWVLHRDECPKSLMVHNQRDVGLLKKKKSFLSNVHVSQPQGKQKETREKHPPKCFYSLLQLEECAQQLQCHHSVMSSHKREKISNFSVTLKLENHRESHCTAAGRAFMLHLHWVSEYLQKMMHSRPVKVPKAAHTWIYMSVNRDQPKGLWLFLLSQHWNTCVQSHAGSRGRPQVLAQSVKSMQQVSKHLLLFIQTIQIYFPEKNPLLASLRRWCEVEGAPTKQ